MWQKSNSGVGESFGQSRDLTGLASNSSEIPLDTGVFQDTMLAQDNNELFLHYNLPCSRLRIISLPVMRTVSYRVPTSRVEEAMSASPKNIIGGIRPITETV